jgi:hypothetical protein
VIPGNNMNNARAGMAVVVDHQFIFIFGGRNSSGELNSIEYLDTQTGNIRKIIFNI